LKGGLGVEELLIREVCLEVLGLRGRLEDAGCLVESMWDDCLVAGGCLGEAGFPVILVVPLGKGRRPIPLKYVFET
jgi:hypothetical protein